MAAVWQKNEVTAAKRRCQLFIRDANNAAVSRGNSYTGYVYITQGGTDYVAAVGTLTNSRRALVVDDDTFTADNATETLTATAHGLETGDGPLRLTNSGGALPTGLATATDYWIIRTGADTFKLASSLANAYASTEVAFTTNGTGTHTISDTASTQRGIDGEFTYTATQAETNYDAGEIVVAILGHATDWGATTASMASEASSVWATVIEDGNTAEDLLRGIARTLLAKFSISGTDYVFRDLADTKDSHEGTVTASGRTAASITDLT